ncbi:MAG: hypothetical protein JJ964_16545 [Rhizobiales bacterium]|nr:hypothetical protein [Hyphomicrobiales bacterium]
MTQTEQQNQLTEDEISKDKFFQRVAAIAEEMVKEHGKDFSMGTLVLAARWIAENKIGAKEETKQN